MNDSIPNPLHFLWNALYDTAESFTGLVGLTPYQVLAGVGVLLLVLVLVQFLMAVTGKRTWNLDG